MPPALRKTNVCTAALIGLILLILSLASEAQTRQTFVVVVANEPPFQIDESWNGSGAYSGVFADAIRTLGERTGLDLEIKASDYSDGLAMLGNGSADMMLGVRWTAQQTLFMEYIGTWFPAEPTVFFLGQDQDDILTYADLASMRIGVLNTARYFHPFAGDESLDKVGFDRYEDAFRALSKGRVDLVLAPRRQGSYLLRQVGMSFQIATYHDPGEPTYTAISKRSPLLLHRNLIAHTFLELQRERLFQRLLEIYDF